MVKVGLFSLALVNTTSCIDETEPTTVATVDQIAESSAATEALLMAMPAYFNTVWDEGRHWSFGYGAQMIIRDLQASDMTKYPDSYGTFYYWEVNKYMGDGYLFGQFTWNYYYGFVLATNNLIGGVNAETATDGQKGYLGAGYAYRAMLYLDMARLYEFLPNDKTSNINADGNDVTNLTIPIIKDGMSMDDARNNPRATRQQMKEFIESDLNLAEEYIPYLTDFQNKTLPDLACVYGLKARLYMWVEDYANAQKYAKLAIENATVKPMSQAVALNTTTGFNDSEPWMWGAKQTSQDRTVTSGIINFTSHICAENYFGYCGLGTGDFCVADKKFYERISDTDWRKLEFKAPEGSPLASKVSFLIPEMATYDKSSQYYCPPYTILKFRPGQGDPENYKDAAAVSYPVMRVEEMYFIEAEAAAHQNASEGKDLLVNFMQNYRDPSYACSVSATDEVVEEIVFQKRVEFIGEGISFFDIKRLNYSVTRGYEGSNWVDEYMFNTNGRPAWMNYVMVRTEANNNPAVKGWNNPDPSDAYDVWVAK